MKTISMISSAVAALAASSTALALATGLPLAFSFLAVASTITLAFGAAVTYAGILRETRRPLSLSTSRGRFTIATARPITRPVRVAA